jgi:hypothetical protein
MVIIPAPARNAGGRVGRRQPFPAGAALQHAHFPGGKRLTGPAGLLYTDRLSVVKLSFSLGEENPCTS